MLETSAKGLQGLWCTHYLAAKKNLDLKVNGILKFQFVSHTMEVPLVRVDSQLIIVLTHYRALKLSNHSTIRILINSKFEVSFYNLRFLHDRCAYPFANKVINVTFFLLYFNVTVKTVYTTKVHNVTIGIYQTLMN